MFSKINSNSCDRYFRESGCSNFCKNILLPPPISISNKNLIYNDSERIKSYSKICPTIASDYPNVIEMAGTAGLWFFGALAGLLPGTKMGDKTAAINSLKSMIFNRFDTELSHIARVNVDNKFVISQKVSLRVGDGCNAICNCVSLDAKFILALQIEASSKVTVEVINDISTKIKNDMEIRIIEIPGFLDGLLDIFKKIIGIKDEKEFKNLIQNTICNIITNTIKIENFTTVNVDWNINQGYILECKGKYWCNTTSLSVLINTYMRIINETITDYFNSNTIINDISNRLRIEYQKKSSLYIIIGIILVVIIVIILLLII